MGRWERERHRERILSFLLTYTAYLPCGKNEPTAEKAMHSRGVMIPALDPDPVSDFLPFGDSSSGFGSSKKRNYYIYIIRCYNSGPGFPIRS